MLIRKSRELLSMDLAESSQIVTIMIFGVVMAARWLEAHVGENNRQEAPSKKQFEELECVKELALFETM